MSFDHTLFTQWPERVKKRLKELSMTQDVLAEKMKITRGAIAHYLSGRRVPPLKQFQKFAEILKVDPVWLQFGIDRNSEKYKKNFIEVDPMHPVMRIPIFSWEQITIVENLEDIDKLKISEYVPHFFTDEVGHYALRIKGDAMTAPTGHTVSFREGEIIIVNQAKQPTHNDCVVVVMPDSKEATFRQFVTDGGTQYLKPLNPQYPLVEVNEGTRFCGVEAYRIGG